MKLNVAPICQTTTNYCGPASALMVIKYRTGSSPLSQDKLYHDYCKDTPDNAMYTSISELHNAIFVLSPGSEATRPYQPRFFTSAQALTVAACKSVAWHCEPVSVVVRGYSHWSVVVGCEFHSGPANPDPLTYDAIRSVWINDPADLSGHQCSCAPSILAKTDVWIGAYLSQMPWLSPQFADHQHYVESAQPGPGEVAVPATQCLVQAFVAFIDDRGADASSAVSCTVGTFPSLSSTFLGSDIAPPVLADDFFPAASPWTAFPDKVEELEPALPFSFMGDDNAQFAAYKWNSASGKDGVPLAVIEDVEGGPLIAVGTESGSLYLGSPPNLLNMGEVVAYVQAIGGFKDDQDGPAYFPTNDDISGGLWWAPCAESLSPFLPFRRFHFVDSDNNSHWFYLRLDGPYFSSLHDLNGDMLEPPENG